MSIQPHSHPILASPNFTISEKWEAGKEEIPFLKVIVVSASIFYLLALPVKPFENRYSDLFFGLQIISFASLIFGKMYIDRLKTKAAKIDNFSFLRICAKKKKYYLLKKEILNTQISKNTRSPFGTTIIHDAIFMNEMVALELLLKHPHTNHLINERIVNCDAFLRKAALKDKENLKKYIDVLRINVKDRMEVMRLGGDITKLGETPLQLAIVKTNVKAIELLLLYGASTDDEDPFSRPVLDYAQDVIGKGSPKKNAIISLLKNGSSITAVD